MGIPTLGSVIYQARVAKGMDLFDLVETTGLPYRIVEYAETGDYIHPIKLNKIVEALDLNSSYVASLPLGPKSYASDSYITPAIEEFVVTLKSNLDSKEVCCISWKLRDAFAEAMLELRVMQNS